MPDLMTVGKGIGGGLALAAVLGTEDVMSTWSSDATTSTFLTNALNERAACAAIDVLLDEGLVERSRVLGDRALARLRAGLAGNPRVGEVRGRGLFVGIELGGETPGTEHARGGPARAARPRPDRRRQRAPRQRPEALAAARHLRGRAGRRHRHHRGGPRMIDVRHLIGGEWVAGPPAFDVIACDDGSVLAHSPEADAELVDRAVTAARAALPAWKAQRAADRAAVLLELADRLEANIEPLAQLISREMGKPIRLSRVRELVGAVDKLRFFAGAARDAAGRRHRRLARAPARPHDPRAARRGGADHPVERPGRPDGAQARRGARRRLHRRRQVVGGDARLDRRVPAAVRRPAGPRAGRHQPAARPRRHHRRRAGRASRASTRSRSPARPRPAR